MDLSDDAEEILEILWTFEEVGRREAKIEDERAIEELRERGLVSVEAGRVRLTDRGREEAEGVVRRHRLAERLLTDVLDVEQEALEEAACRFEHVIREGIEDSVCTLLGHPRLCPHGNPIPRGRCCRRGYKRAERIVVSLSELEPGQEGRIAYIHSRSMRRLQRLISLGITPGARIRVIQRFPSHVFRVGQTQIAVDDEIAGEIYVLRIG